MGANLASLLSTTAEASGERTAVKLGSTVLTYAELDDRSARLAALLADRGLGRGDRVGVMLPNVPEFAVCYFGVLRAGGVVVPMNPLLKDREVSYYLTDAGATLLFAWHELADDASKGAADAGTECVVVDPTGFAELLGDLSPVTEVVEVDGDDTAVLLYTSGTTGKPKGAELRHDNLRTNAVTTAETVCALTSDDVLLGALPLFHAFGQTCALNAAVCVGASLSLLPRFDPGQALEVLSADRVTVFEGVPTMFNALLHFPGRADHDVSALRLCVSGGAAMPAEVMRGFEEEFGCDILEGYGLSETSPVASFNHPGRERKPGTIGTPLRGVEMKVVDDDGQDLPSGEPGEIVIRGENVMRGYWNRPDATAEAVRDGWFHTGDIATVDTDGYFTIVDRKKDLIIRGGMNVYPREVEEVLYEHPDVAEAAVVAVPHPSLGEDVGAAVVLRDGGSATPDDLRDWVKERVAAYKYPRQVWLLDELPKGPTGKLLKREIEVPADVSSH
jgi:long-chain acyl-CoA synthetase